MLCFTALVPHPPLIIPAIGQRNVESLASTIHSYLKLSLQFLEAKPDIVVMLSSHAPALHHRISLTAGKKLSGDFDLFGHPEIQFEFAGDPQFSRQIEKCAFEHAVQVDPYISSDDHLNILDDGSMIALYYLRSVFPQFNVIICGQSDFSAHKHFSFGKSLYESVFSTEKRVAVIGSLDLSHTLSKNASHGFRPEGEIFDEKVLEIIKSGNFEKITHVDEDLIFHAKPCGYQTLCTLLGFAHQAKLDAQLLSYESPWGIGHALVSFS